MSDLNRSELIARMGGLVERVSADEHDLSAITELDRLGPSSAVAKEIYLEQVWMQVQMRSSSVLLSEIGDRTVEVGPTSPALNATTENVESETTWTAGRYVSDFWWRVWSNSVWPRRHYQKEKIRTRPSWSCCKRYTFVGYRTLPQIFLVSQCSSYSATC